MEKEINATIKEFLSNFPYHVVHETGTDNKEYYFCVIDKDDTDKNIVLTSYFNAYTKNYPLTKLTDKALNYMKNHKNYYHFVFIDSLPKNDKFFNEKENFIKENANNILSIRTIGEAADIDAHLANNAEICYEKIKQISSHTKNNIISNLKKIKNKIV